MLLESLKDVLPYNFAYENINYSRYLTVMLGEMEMLEMEKTDILHEFETGSFSVLLFADKFSRIESERNDC